MLIVEGEKCADAAVELGYVVVTWSAGANAVDATDWSPLSGRDVTIWPDADGPGAKAAAEIRKTIGKGTILDVRDKPKGWDVADAVAKGWTPDKVLQFIEERSNPRVEPQKPPAYLDEVSPSESATAAPGRPVPPAVIVKVSPLDWGEVKRTGKQPRRWIMTEWMSPDPMLFAGAGGIGKTLLAQQLGTALSIGKGILAPVEREWRVLMWACEDGKDELGNRAIDIATYLNIDMEDLNEKFYLIPRRGLDNTLFAAPYDQPGFTALLAELEEQINDWRINVFFLDNIAQTYAAKENDRHQATRYVNGIFGCARHTDFAPVIMGHPAKAAGSEYSGSTAWENAVRMRWYLGDRLPDEKQSEADEEVDTRPRVLAKRKTNYSGKDWRRFTFDNGVLVPEQIEVGSTGVVDMLRRRKARGVTLDAMRKFVVMGKTVSDAKGQNYLPKLIGEHKLNDGLLRAELEDAMRELMNDGKLKRGEVGRYANRDPKFGLMEVSE